MKKDWKGLVNNPLGIIGFFLVIVEGMASFVITSSSLDWYHNLILVIFLVIFPFCVLWVFYAMVTRFKDNIYGPHDFDNDQAFLEYTNKNTGQSVEFSSILTKDKHINNDHKIELIKKKNNIKLIPAETWNEKLSTLVKVNFRVPKYEELVGNLKTKGFNAVAYYPEDPFEIEIVELETMYNSIWIGKNISYEVVKELFKALKEKNFESDFSFGNVYINYDEDKEIFIGAYHSISKRVPNFKQITAIDSKHDFDKVPEIYKAHLK